MLHEEGSNARMDILSIYTRAHRKFVLLAAAALTAAIALTDWLTKPYISIGFLYLFPIMLISGILPRWQMIGVAFVCAILQEAFSNLPPVKRSCGLFSRSQVLPERDYLSSSQCEIAAS